MPSTIRIFSGFGPGLAAGPANRDPKMIPLTGVGVRPAPVVRPDSSSIREAISSCCSCSSACSRNGLEAGLDPVGCCIDTERN
jgi:hypothetical protein